MGPGEAEVMLLALENEGLVAILDDSLAWIKAHILNIPFTGTLGLLQDAKKIGLTRSVGPVLDTLIALQCIVGLIIIIVQCRVDLGISLSETEVVEIISSIRYA